ncbi:MAG: hypothetical protein JOY78_12770 [Pseudonocardia sp.]|nr:hypothetical protein [Pseudonocardia sp.]
MSDQDVAEGFLWYPLDPTPDGVELELRRRGLWDLLLPARAVCLMLSAQADEEALASAVRVLPDATWHYLASDEQVLSGRRRAQFMIASGGYREFWAELGRDRDALPG